MARENGEKVVATNRKARHDYLIEDTYEAGIVLTGTEVKSLRQGRASLVDAYATIDRGGGVARGCPHSRIQRGHLDESSASAKAQTPAT